MFKVCVSLSPYLRRVGHFSGDLWSVKHTCSKGADEVAARPVWCECSVSGPSLELWFGRRAPCKPMFPTLCPSPHFGTAGGVKVPSALSSGERHLGFASAVPVGLSVCRHHSHNVIITRALNLQGLLAPVAGRAVPVLRALVNKEGKKPFKFIKRMKNVLALTAEPGHSSPNNKTNGRGVLFIRV